MDVNQSNSHSHERKPSCGSKNGEEDEKSIERDANAAGFINHAEIAWHESRRVWIGDQSKKSQRKAKEPIMSWTSTYEDLLLSTEPFPQSIPLAEMVDFLVDVWQEEGLYD